jgi:hypothetical protein
VSQLVRREASAHTGFARDASQLGREPLEVTARIAGFVLVLVGAVLMPAPVRAAHAVTGPTPA